VRAASSSAEGFKSGIANLGAETEFKMRTPVYFISHGGVSLIQAGFFFFGFFVLGYSIGLFSTFKILRSIFSCCSIFRFTD
jgi:hypothetical protein